MDSGVVGIALPGELIGVGGSDNLGVERFSGPGGGLLRQNWRRLEIGPPGKPLSVRPLRRISGPGAAVSTVEPRAPVAEVFPALFSAVSRGWILGLSAVDASGTVGSRKRYRQGGPKAPAARPSRGPRDCDLLNFRKKRVSPGRGAKGADSSTLEKIAADPQKSKTA